MMNNINIKRLDHTDLNIYQCGSEDCASGHYFGPAVRDHFLIHFIRSGKGFFQVGNKTYHLGEGQGFLICPDIVTYYQADYEDPWKYTWVGFHGLKAGFYLKKAGLTAESPIFTYTKDNFIKDCFSQMSQTKALVKSREIRLLGLFYMFLSQLIEVSQGTHPVSGMENRKEYYVKQVIQYIEMNYSRKITVQDIAAHIGLDRSYIGSVFRKHLTISIQEFLIKYRVNKACELMKNDLLSIGDISRSVGYDDPLLFSKVFKKAKGKAPKAYRKENIH